MQSFEIGLSIFNVSAFWLIFGAVCVAIEAIATGVGFMFVGFAAISVGVLILLEVIGPTNLIAQIATLLALTTVWGAILWLPLKKFLKKSEFKNIIGDIAIVEGAPLTKNSTSHVKWSGTIMRARLDEGSKPASKGDEVIITATEGNTLIVALKQ